MREVKPGAQETLVTATVPWKVLNVGLFVRDVRLLLLRGAQGLACSSLSQNPMFTPHCARLSRISEPAWFYLVLLISSIPFDVLWTVVSGQNRQSRGLRGSRCLSVMSSNVMLMLENSSTHKNHVRKSSLLTEARLYWCHAVFIKMKAHYLLGKRSDILDYLSIWSVTNGMRTSFVKENFFIYGWFGTNAFV